MTTVAYRDGILASDSRSTSKYMIEDDRCQKIWRLPDGSLLGGAGDYAAILKTVALFQHIIKTGTKKDLPQINAKGLDLILVEPDASMWWWCSNHWYNMGTSAYLAVGSGREFATGALDAGADARTAVQVGIKRDKWSGGRVRSLTLRQ